MTPSRETKAGPWFKARSEGRRLPEHIVCDWCGSPATPDDFNPTAGCVICPACLETMVNERANEPRAEVGLVGGGA